MSSVSAPRLAHAFRTASRLCANATMAIGVLGLAAWTFHAERLLQTFPGEVAMAPNTAIGFLLLGLSLRGRVGASRPEVVLARTTAAAAAALGALSLAQSLTGSAFGIDELLFRDSAGVTGTPPGRMSVPAAVCFIALGLASVLPRTRRAHAAAFGLLIPPLLLAGVSLTGYAYGAPSVHWIWGVKGMAFLASVGFLLAGASFFHSDPEHGIAALFAGDTLGGVVVRRAFPLALVALLILGWLSMRADERGISRGLGMAMEEVASIVLMGTIIVWSGVTIGRIDSARRRAEEALRQSQKMEAVGRLAGGVAHDFNNILTIISGYGDLLRKALPAGSPHRDSVQEILAAADRATDLTRQLLAFSRKQVLEPRALDLNRIVGGMDRMLQRVIGEDVQLVTLLEPGLSPVLADPGQVEQILMNLAVNARDAMPNGGRLTLETRSVEIDEAHARPHAKVRSGSYVMLAVSDTGVGMDEATLARAFEPFFTTKGAGKGTGLGLATVYGIVEQSGGSVSARSAPGRGTTIEIYLPRSAEPAQPEQAPPPDGRAPAVVRGTILLVEDDPAVRRLAREVLKGKGYDVLDAADAVEAVRFGREHPAPIDLLVSDVVMPEVSGPEVVARVRELRPGLRVLFMSGYSEAAVNRQGVIQEGAAFIGKPFSPSSLVEKVREVLEG